MTLFFRIFLLVNLALFFLFLMVFRAYVVWKQTGKNPIIRGKKDNAHNLMSSYLMLIMLMLAGFVITNVVVPESYNYFLPITWLENIYLQDVGAAFMIIALVLTFIAQAQMRESWRLGIDEQTKTALVHSGLFNYSRNPIYLGMEFALLGAFFIAPTGTTLLLLVLSYMLLQIQIRLEEEFLTKLHGQAYLDFKRKVRRWI
ncbi:MAG: methyltransferase [Chitinophagales bacterium]|nr:methyltransferase [Chitinophagales bacterium]